MVKITTTKHTKGDTAVHDITLSRVNGSIEVLANLAPANSKLAKGLFQAGVKKWDKEARTKFLNENKDISSGYHISSIPNPLLIVAKTLTFASRQARKWVSGSEETKGIRASQPIVVNITPPIGSSKATTVQKKVSQSKY